LIPKVWLPVSLVAALVLTACGPYPDARAHSRAVAREAQRNAPPPGMRRAEADEIACLNAAVAAGHQVYGVAPRSPSGAVTVRVVTASGTADLACAYVPATGAARIAPA
jgi:hypothetical protein